MPLSHCPGASLISKCEHGIFLAYQSLILQRSLLQEIDKEFPGVKAISSVINQLTESIETLKKEMS